MHETASTATAPATAPVDDVHVAEIKKHVRVYLIVFAALAVLTVVTVAVAYLHLPIVPAVVLALVIASVKAGLVAGYFMHLVSEKKVIYAILIMTVVFLVGMFVLTLSSYYDQEGGMNVP